MSSFIIEFPPTLIPTIIAILSVLATAIVIERFHIIYYIIAKKGNNQRIEILEDVNKPDLQDLKLQFNAYIINKYNICLVALSTSDQTTQMQLEAIADDEMLKLSLHLKRRLMALGTISTIAPLAGLLGTVTGMIKSFHAFTIDGVQNAQLMGGVDEALVTTAMGLMVGIPSLVFYNIFATKVNTLLSKTQITLNQIIASKIFDQSKNTL